MKYIIIAASLLIGAYTGLFFFTIFMLPLVIAANNGGGMNIAISTSCIIGCLAFIVTTPIVYTSLLDKG